MVWWNEVSKTVTCATPGSTVSMASMPWRLAGLCSGAIWQSDAIFCFTSSSTRQLAGKNSPPCATRWPTAFTSSSDAMTPCVGSVRACITSSMPVVWSGMGRCSSNFSLPTGLCVRSPSGRPMRSTRPLANSLLDAASMSITWYLIDDEPQFRTKITILVSFFLNFAYCRISRIYRFAARVPNHHPAAVQARHTAMLSAA